MEITVLTFAFIGILAMAHLSGCAFSFTTHPIFAPLITLTVNALVYSVGLRKIKTYGKRN
jgi:hypothetical protein